MVIDLRTCVVIGGRGFIGRSLVLRLLKLDDRIVRIADSAQSVQLDPSETNSLLSQALSTGRASYFHVDVRNKPQIINAIEGSSVVFYVEAGTSSTHDFYGCYTLIVQGAKNVINACRECKVKRLIYNSSADVVFDGSYDIHNGDESLLYAWKFEDMLTDLKAQAEALFLFANDIDGLLTCALRPSNVFGPGDTEIIPFLVNQAKFGWAKAFFITNLEPVKFWEFVSRILEDLGYQRPMIKLPATLVWYTVLLVKWMHAKMASTKLNGSAPLHGVVRLALRTSTFNCSAAQKHIGYSPVVSLEEGVTLTIKSFSHLARDSSFGRHSNFDEHLKAEKLLGSGKVANILLWRDEKKTFTCFLALVLLYYWFFFSGRTFTSSAAKVLLLVTVTLLGHAFLPSNILGFTVERISSSSFEISEVDMTNLVAAIACMWNRVVHVTRALAQGEDWNLFFKMAVSLYFLKVISSHYLTEAIGVGLVLAFTSFFVYEQYEEEIDGIVNFLLNAMRTAMVLLMDNLPVSVTSFLRNTEMLHENRNCAMEKD
ncbi:3beta-hydroxysteroid-dehydrogenase/decarboxylase isoform X2 [Camellia sinensis]|uniref:3beta-hydroxysteroid-dehydrogenase/decarboxylase isoform X2 n=1 Tax=Camellia sinensis TaxID=4442 RepID=UPI00103588BF|nr:3beta-hydroxysteroid-dehydrogenase/decarboxylase isoform X2 [Camellia sinensis]